MTLGEAKTDLSIQLEVKRRLGKNREADALKLGIEALKQVEEYRTHHILSKVKLLPGETKD